MVAEVAYENTGSAAYPGRFRAAPKRNARLAFPLKVLGRVREPDPALMDRLGRRMFARDELGAELARAMGRRKGDPERVTMAQFHRALEHGIDGVPDAPAALRRFFAVVDEVPEWVDFELLEHGARALRRMNRVASDVLLQLSLIGGYRFGGPADLLVETGGLTGSTAMRRLGETQKWALATHQPGAMRRDGEGFKLTVHVRAMHALMNDRFERNGRWDTGRWGLPINQSDQAATLALFFCILLIGARLLGWIVPPKEAHAIMHLGRYVGWLMGVDEDWLFDTEREQTAFMYHVILAQGDVTPAGAALSGSLVEGMRTLRYGRLNKVRAEYTRLRLLSMLRFFLRKDGMRDLELPITPVWAIPGVVARNLLESGLIARTRAGRRLLERVNGRFAEREMTRRFGAARPAIGALPS